MNSAKPVAAAIFLLLAASFPAAADDAVPSSPPVADAEPAPTEPKPEAEPKAEADAAEGSEAAGAKPAAKEEARPSAAPATAAAAAPAVAPRKAPWRGSSLSYSHTARAISADKGYEGHWNPYYVHRLALRPQWSFGDQLYLRGSFDLGQELTTADDTNSRYEVVYGDPVLDVGAVGFKDPLLGIQFGGSLRLGAGLSKVSQAQTKFLTIGPGVSVMRGFDVLNGVSVRYDARYTERLHRSTTSLYEASTLVICETTYVAQCDATTSSGVRNVQRDVLQSLGLGFSPHARVSFSAQGLLSHGFLYALTADSRLADGGLDAGGVNTRYAWGFNVGASVKLTKELSLNAGASTFVPQLDVDGTRQHPFYDRLTNVYLDLGLDLEALLQRL